MSKQWLMVGGVVAGLVAGAAILVKFTPEDVGVGINQVAPDYRAVNLASGDSVSLRDLGRGNVTLVNIWATWCGPCREEMPSMQATYAALRDRGFRILAVSIDDGGDEKIRAFAQELGITFDLLHDASGRIQQVYQTTGVPESFLLDREGRIIKRVIGAHDWSSAANRRLLARSLGIPEDEVPAPATVSAR